MAPREVEALMAVFVISVALLLTPVSSDIVFPVSGCMDGDTRCPGLAAVGSCRLNPTYMSSVCPYSCNLCYTTTTSSTAATTVPAAATTTFQPNTTPPLSRESSSTANPETETTVVPPRSIVNPDFVCGGPRSSSHSRTTRQASVQEQQREDSPFAVLASGEGGVQPIHEASCGASPISPRFLITAAYCVLDPDHPVTSVRLGDIDLAQENENNSMPADYTIVKVILPPNFVDSNRYDDIALLKTDRKIEFSDFVFPYCLSASTPPIGTQVIAAGFGYINETHKSTHLMEGTLRVLPTAQCEEKYLQQEEQRLRKAYPSLLQGRNGLLCAGDEEIGVCKGDEGGPLLREDEMGRRFLDGIISFTGSVCGAGVLPGVFTAVANYVDFIDSIIYGEEQP